MFDRAGTVSRCSYRQSIGREKRRTYRNQQPGSHSHGKIRCSDKDAIALEGCRPGVDWRPTGKERPGHLSCSRSTVRRTNQSWFHYCPRWQLLCDDEINRNTINGTATE